MCGIFGAITNQGAIDVPLLMNASSTLRHRGPDAYGFFFEGFGRKGVYYNTRSIPEGNYQIGLGHQRLSIIDLSNGNQPLSNEDNTVWTVLNGEIYNYRFLRQVLTERGHVFKTNSDTEVLCHGYEEWENGIVEHIEGIFSFCIYDSNRKLATLFRDPIGVKPLYYYLQDHLFCFSSELKAILTYHSAIKIRDENVFEFLLFDQIPDLKTPFQNLFKLDAGEFCVLDCSTMEIKKKNKYWDYHFQTDGNNERDIVSQVQKTLKRAVNKQLVSDVPIAIFLSGGIDSTLIAKILLEEGNFTAFHLCSEDGFSEYPWVKKIEPWFTIPVIKVFFDPTLEDCLDSLKNVDDPLYDPSLLPTFLVSREVSRNGFKVVLGGDGGDENFAGYDVPFYPAHLFSKYKNRSIHFWGKSFLFKLMNPRYFETLRKYIDNQSIFPLYREVMMNNLLSSRKWAKNSVIDFRQKLLLSSFHASEAVPELDKLLYLWYRTMLEPVILKKVDIASMANSVEVRVPYLDREMVDLALSIPFEHKIRKRGKYPLKAIAQKFLGRRFAYRPKRGFTFDFSKVFLKPEVEAYLKNNLKIRGMDYFLDIPSILRLVEINKKEPVQGKKLWRAFMFTEWYKNWGAKHI